MNQPWKIEEGLKLIRALQGRVREFGYHIALGGGVLNNGTSDKDLDLYFLPFNNPNIAKEDTHGLLEWLSKLWGEPRTIGEYPDQPSDDGPILRRHRLGGQWVVRAGPPGVAVPLTPPPPPQFLVNEDEPMPAQPDGDVEWARNLSPKKNKKVESSYKYKLKFERAGNDRIDVFVI